MPRSKAVGDSRKLTVQETAVRLSVSVDTVLRLIADGELEAIDVSAKLGTRRNLRVPIVGIERFEARRGTK